MGKRIWTRRSAGMLLALSALGLGACSGMQGRWATLYNDHSAGDLPPADGDEVVVEQTTFDALERAPVVDGAALVGTSRFRRVDEPEPDPEADAEEHARAVGANYVRWAVTEHDPPYTEKDGWAYRAVFYRTHVGPTPDVARGITKQPWDAVEQRAQRRAARENEEPEEIVMPGTGAPDTGSSTTSSGGGLGSGGMEASASGGTNASDLLGGR